MNVPAPLLLAGLLSLALTQGTPVTQQGEQATQKNTQKKSSDPVTRYHDGEGERLGKEIQGSWMMTAYVDPREQPLGDSVTGFATFHDGFLTMMIAVEGLEKRLFRVNEHVFLSSGAYRYRFDQRATLQLATVMRFTNDTGDGEILKEPSGTPFEYYVKLANGQLELRDIEGVTLTFRKIESGEFPASAVRKLESRRGGADPWEND